MHFILRPHSSFFLSHKISRNVHRKGSTTDRFIDCSHSSKPDTRKNCCTHTMRKTLAYAHNVERVDNDLSCRLCCVPLTDRSMLRLLWFLVCLLLPNMYLLVLLLGLRCHGCSAAAAAGKIPTYTQLYISLHFKVGKFQISSLPPLHLPRDTYCLLFPFITNYTRSSKY